MKRVLLVLCLMLAALAAAPAWAKGDDYSADPFDPRIARDSWNLIGKTEAAYGVPLGLLHAMSLVETGQGISGWMMPWPYTVCVNSTGTQRFLSLDAAIPALANARKMGYVRFDATAGGRRLSNASLTDVTALFALNAKGNDFSFTPKPYGRRFSNAADATAFVYRMFAMGNRNLDLGLMQVNWRVHGSHFASVAQLFDPQINVRYAVGYLLEQRATRDWWGSVGRYHSGTPSYAHRYVMDVYGWYKRVHQYNAQRHSLAAL
jgi:hypothetical protein